MGFASRGITSAAILAAITDDDTRFSGADIATIEARAAITKFAMLDFWGESIAQISIDTTPTDRQLADIVIPNLGTYTIIAAYALISVGQLANSQIAEKYNAGTTYIQVDKAAAGYINAITLRDRLFHMPAETERSAFYITVGNVDISSRVANNATTNVKWTASLANGDSLTMRGITSGIRLLVGE